MSRRKLESASLFLTLFGGALMVPPLVQVLPGGWALFGIPGGAVYLFGLWAVLIVCARLLSNRLPDEGLAPAEPDKR